MIEPIISLAFSVQSKKGVYALLLGSGVSRGAGIPTGWEIVKDLIEKVANLKGEDCKGDPADWYREKFGKDADYSELLKQIAKKPAERSQLLRGYFEPTDDEREKGEKSPTEAHSAIAEMVSHGYIKVIITTNFDQLLETVLKEKQINPTVISTPDQAKGTLPLTHVDCLILKVHGDYLDIRIKNTLEELSEYDDATDSLLDRIFDEHGLIVCGWSAEWDTALCNALERRRSQRFTTYWTLRGKASEKVKKLNTFREAEKIEIKDANSFFHDLSEKVLALEAISRPHPLSVKMAVATVKKYLAEDKYLIPLHDLVMQETEKLHAELTAEHFPPHGSLTGKLMGILSRYDALLEVLQAIIITGCHWGRDKHVKTWVDCMERIANQPFENGQMDSPNLRHYPALVLLYSGGIAAIANENYYSLTGLFVNTRVRVSDGESPLAGFLHTGEVMDDNVQKLLPDKTFNYLPLSDYLFEILQEPLKTVIPSEIKYRRCFYRFEYLLCLIYTDCYQRKFHRFRGPIGRFWRTFRPDLGKNIKKEIDDEVDRLGSNWPPLQAGLFDGYLERFQEVKRQYDEYVSKATGTWH